MTVDENEFKAIIEALRKAPIAARESGRAAQKESAEVFARNVIQNIMTDPYSFAPLSQRYAEWKAGHGNYKEGFWKLMGDLMNSLAVVDTDDGNGYGVGFPEGVYDSGGKSYGKKGSPKEIAQIAEWLEAGREMEQQPRPLIHLTREDFIRDQWVSFALKALLRGAGAVWI